MLRYILSVLFTVVSTAAIAAPTPEHWVVYYTDSVPVDKFTPFDVIVFDSDSHPPILSLKAQHKTLIGYLSLGEAESYRTYYKDLESKNLLLKANPNWKDHRVIDVRNPAWASYVTDTLIPPILAQGFDGIMLDTMDSVIQLEDDDPKQYAGMKQAAVILIKTIRARYPNIKIMLNRGFNILPLLAGSVDMVMAETTYSLWSPDTKPALVPIAERQYYLDLLHAAQQQSPALKIYTIDYWPPDDKKGVENVYRAQRAEGFVPYVATPNLQNIYMEPQ
jgi:uncharacterized protein (TIGR01370 family)